MSNVLNENLEKLCESRLKLEHSDSVKSWDDMSFQELLERAIKNIESAKVLSHLDEREKQLADSINYLNKAFEDI